MARLNARMARPNGEVTCYWCSQSFMRGFAPEACPICSDQGSQSNYLKAGSPGETGDRGEWRCDSCHRLISGRVVPYYQGSGLLCRTCRTRTEYDFAAKSYLSSGDLKRFFHNRRNGRTRPSVPSPGAKKKQMALSAVRQPSVAFKGEVT